MGDFIFIIFAIIIYFLRLYSESKNNNLFIDNWDIDYNSSFRMDRIAERAEKRLELDRELREYINTHTMQNKLENSYCFLKYWKMPSGTLTFSCRERSMSNKKGRVFTVRGDDNHVATMWALINMKYTPSMTYDSILQLYNFHNNGANYYLYENNEQFYYITMTDYEADNEYCEMTIITEKEQNWGTESGIIICRELWRKDRARSFRIEGNMSYLFSIIQDLKKTKNSNLQYKDLLAKYKADKNCRVYDGSEKKIAPKLKINPVDINNATEEEISAIPKLNIIMAKKIVKRREEINGFQSVDEVLDFLNVKSSASNDIRNAILINPIKQEPVIEKTDERSVDL